MQTTLLIHILAGGLGLVTGFVALFAAKGGRLHRKSGMLFVYAMLPMATLGAVIAALRSSETSVIVGVLTAYLVITGLTALRPPGAGSRWLDLGALLVALGVALAGATLGLEALAGGKSHGDGVSAVMCFIFAAVALLAGLGDLRKIWTGGLPGARRLARHLWRMGFALWIASGSFFLGQADEIPEPLRIPALLAFPAFLPLLVMLYWLWRVRIRRASRRIAAGSPHEAF